MVKIGMTNTSNIIKILTEWLRDKTVGKLLALHVVFLNAVRKQEQLLNTDKSDSKTKQNRSKILRWFLVRVFPIFINGTNIGYKT